MMKTLRKVLFIGVIIFGLIFVSAYVFLLLQGKAIITRQLEKSLHKKVTLDYVGLTFPLNLEIRKLEIAGLAKVESAFISPSILGLLTGNIVLNDLKLSKPEFVYEKIVSRIQAPSVDINTTPPKKQFPPLMIKRLIIKEGKLDFIDYTVGSDGIRITVIDINLNVVNAYMYPRSIVTDFALSGKIPWQEGAEEGKFEIKGWLNLFKKDMQATVKITDIDGIYLYPYYAQWVDLEKARIEKAKLNLTSNIQSTNNNLTAQCHLELTDIVFKPRPEEEQADKAEKIAAAVLDIFKTLNKGKIVFNFTIRTKMINPAFNFSEIKDAFEARLTEGRKNNHLAANIVRFPGRIVGGTVKSATDLSKGLIGGALSVAKGLKEAVAVAFRKEFKEGD